MIFRGYEHRALPTRGAPESPWCWAWAWTLCPGTAGHPEACPSLTSPLRPTAHPALRAPSLQVPRLGLHSRPLLKAAPFPPGSPSPSSALTVTFCATSPPLGHHADFHLGRKRPLGWAGALTTWGPGSESTEQRGGRATLASAGGNRPCAPGGKGPTVEGEKAQFQCGRVPQRGNQRRLKQSGTGEAQPDSD